MRNRILLSALSGVLLGVSWPTYGFPFIIFFSFVPLLLVEELIVSDDSKKKGLKVFLYAWLAFFIWNIITTQWLYYSQRPDGSNAWEAFLMPLFANSLFMAITYRIYFYVRTRVNKSIGILFLPVMWICFERLHLNWDLSWPWLNLGNVFSEYTWVVQWYEYTGTMGGTLWIFVVNILMYKIIVEKRTWKEIARVIVILLLPILLSLYRYYSYESKSDKKIEVVLVQPKLDPYKEKYKLTGDEILESIFTQAEKSITPNTKYVVAPETAFPGNSLVYIDEFSSNHYINKIKEWRSSLGDRGDFNFVSGVDLGESYEVEKTKTASYILQTGRWVDIYNGAIQISQGEDSVQYYKKSKLVPGVEIIPFSRVIKPILGEALLNFGGAQSNLGTQEKPSVFKWSNFAIAPIICYESIYGEYVSEYVKAGANVLFIMTNDSWWQNSEGHKQLLSYARLRAIETRREVVRSANSGISAHINNRGDIVQALEYDEQGSIRVGVQPYYKMTFYVKYGDYIARICLILMGLVLGYVFTKNILKNNLIKKL